MFQKSKQSDEKYSEAEINEIDNLDFAEKYINNEIDENVGPKNKKPAVPTVTQVEIQKKSFTLEVKSTDPEGEQLVYKIYIGNSKEDINNLQYTSELVDSR